MARPDLRRNDEMRRVKLTAEVNDFAEGSVLAEVGKTKVLCTATVEKIIPPARKGTGTGWVTAQYGRLPRAGRNRQARSGHEGADRELGERIAQALRSVCELNRLDECTVTVDCDVLQVDGEPLTAAVVGGTAALYLALHKRRQRGHFRKMPLKTQLAAVSAGICDGEAVLDLSEAELEKAEAALCVMMTGEGEIVELRRIGEGRPFAKTELEKMLSLCKKGTGKLCREQRKMTGELE